MGSRTAAPTAGLASGVMGWAALSVTTPWHRSTAGDSTAEPTRKTARQSGSATILVRTILPTSDEAGRSHGYCSDCGSGELGGHPCVERPEWEGRFAWVPTPREGTDPTGQGTMRRHARRGPKVTPETPSALCAESR